MTASQPEHEPQHELDQVQRWMQTVITHPDGIEAGINSPEANQHIPISSDEVEQVIRRSQMLTSIERLEIYGNAYYSRLLECMQSEFPALLHALGEETFDGFAFGYLQSYPSRSYTLGNLGRFFAQYLAETRPAPEQDEVPEWPDFMIELATLERLYGEVFDGEGMEREPGLLPSDLANLSPEDWENARLAPAPCLRLIKLQFPVHEYVSGVRREEDPEIPDPQTTWLVVTRREYVVRRASVSELEYALIEELVAGRTVAEAIETIASRPDCDMEKLPAQLQEWFTSWSAARYFRSVEVAR